MKSTTSVQYHLLASCSLSFFFNIGIALDIAAATAAAAATDRLNQIEACVGVSSSSSKVHPALSTATREREKRPIIIDGSDNFEDTLGKDLSIIAAAAGKCVL